MTAHKMTVLYDDNAKSSKSQEKSELSARDSKNSSIKRIDAKQDVKVFSSDFVASSDFGHYNPKDNLFVLEKNVIVNNGDSVAVGEKFIYSLQTRKGSFVGKSGNLKTGEDKRVVVTIGKDAKKPKKKE